MPSSWSGDGKGNAEVINGEDMGYGVKLLGERNHHYQFTLTDESGTDYNFEYYFDDPLETVIVNFLGKVHNNQSE